MFKEIHVEGVRITKHYLNSESEIQPQTLHPRLISVVRAMSLQSKYPVKVTSSLRSKEWELHQGRSGNSRHCLGNAVDFSGGPTASDFLHSLGDQLHAHGLGVGYYGWGIHVDTSGNTWKDKSFKPRKYYVADHDVSIKKVLQGIAPQGYKPSGNGCAAFVVGFFFAVYELITSREVF